MKSHVVSLVLTAIIAMIMFAGVLGMILAADEAYRVPFYIAIPVTALFMNGVSLCVLLTGGRAAGADAAWLRTMWKRLYAMISATSGRRRPVVSAPAQSAPSSMIRFIVFRNQVKTGGQRVG